MDCNSGNFHRFSQLPQAIRLRVWTYAAFIPRVVELHEHLSSTYREGKQEAHTTLQSRTRPPALLQTCAEARNIALGIYVPLYKHAHSTYTPYSPIYANPISDITYRGLHSEPFRLFGPNHKKDVVPLGGTRTLAVNSRVLRDYGLVGEGSYKDHRIRGDLRIPQQLMECARHGLALLIIVIDNEEDHAEFILEDVDQSCIRARDILSEVADLRAALSKYWLHKTWIESSTETPKLPVIKVMKVKRRKEAIPPFHQFSKLPQELQNEVWDYASNTRRVICVSRTTRLDFPDTQDSLYRLRFSHRQPPPLLSVCKASRMIAMKKLALIPGTTLQKPGWYNESLDVVVVPKWDRHSNAFSNFKIQYLGVPYRGEASNPLDAPFIHHIEGVKKVIILIGTCHENSDVSLIPITEPYEKTGSQITFSERYCQARDKTYQLRSDMEKFATQWNTLQKKKAENGGNREPDWVPPAIKAARMVAVSRVVSPYSRRMKNKDE